MSNKEFDFFQDRELGDRLVEKIREEAKGKINIMEICGTHTRSIYEYGIDKLMPENINLVAGPGCPICVAPSGYIDAAIELARRGNIVVTFGDMIRVPGTFSTLQKERGNGADIKVIYSPLDCIKIAEKNPNKEVIFMAVGFETTAPAIALMVIKARGKGIKNLSVLLSLKTMPRVMETLLLDKELKIDGFLCPGHVSTIIGQSDFQDLAEKYEVPMCIVGFEPIDILGGILSLINMINDNKYKCENKYNRFVRVMGNITARNYVDEVFQPCDSNWRGLGSVKKSGYKLRKEFEAFDAFHKFSLGVVEEKKVEFCLCGEVIKGKSLPSQCRLYGKSCTPMTPVGPCMVSMEGTCNIAYNFEVV